MLDRAATPYATIEHDGLDENTATGRTRSTRPV